MISNTTKSLPVVPRLRSIKNILRFVRNPIPILEEYGEEFGDTFTFYIGGKDMGILSTNPDFVQHVLQKNHRNYHKSEVQTKILGRYVGKGLLTSDGPYWLQQRRLIQPGFHRKKLAALVDIMQNEIDDYLNKLDTQKNHNKVVDISKAMMELTFRVVAKSLFGSRVEEQDLNELGQNITILQEFIIKQIRQPFLLPWFKISGQMKHHKNISDHSKSIIMKYIHKRRKEAGEHDDLLDMLINARYEDTGEGMTDQQLLDESLIIFVAGHETTANAMTWTWYLLSQHPDVIQKIKKELSEVLGKRSPTFEDLPKLAYLSQVIQESMRVYPPAWITDRVAIEDDEIEGYHIPKGTIVAPFIYGVHHSKNLWNQPDQFDPSRFEKSKLKDQHSFAYLPFGGGPRLCIGNNFALMEMQLIIARMIRRFDLELVEGQNIELMPMVTLRPKENLMMKVT